ncbi:hypothetical protein FD755_013587 [Muntiacus reevesi]|uniref:Hexosyltransferase n=1 Tax=Muntiacus reevesi TaxID=9886 RepID=A0A5N3XLZ8_MUNRE|nr:hypothetical protein FD755_013587 [Muntiacus reevesi]
MSLRSLQWRLLLLLLFRFLVMWHLSLPPHHGTIQNFHFTLQEHSNYSHQNPFLVILVILLPSDEKVRQVIKVIWGAKKSWWRYEQLNNNNNLILKMIMAFRRITEFCPNVRYIMKTDTDVFINTGKLKFFTDYPLTDIYPSRRFYQKAHISYLDMCTFKVFPPKCSGLDYIMFRDLVPIKFSEDIYVRICLNLLKVDIHIPENTNLFFLYRNHLDVYQLRCVTEAHDFSSKEIITLWRVC